MNYKISNSYSLWFTGYPSSGKSTIAKLLKAKLKVQKIPVLILDGDEIRKNFFHKLKYNKLDRMKSLKFAISLVKFLMRIKKRIGPQRTNIAIESIKNKDWQTVCKSVLEYYDKCYEHEKTGKNNIETLNMTDICDDQITLKMINDFMKF